MSSHYILDGYNVLHSDPRWSDLPREKKRLEFLRMVEASRPAGREHNSVTVVLDGYAASLKDLCLRGVKIVFSGDRDADTAIKEMVADHSHPREVVVVTNDRGIQAVVRRSGAQIMSCENFFSLQRKKPTGSLLEKQNPQDLDSINSELKKIWKLD